MKAKYIFVFLFSLTLNYSYSQDNILEVREDENTKVSEECLLVKADVKNIVSSLLIQFQQVCTFIDRSLPEGETAKVTEKSQEAFSEMFEYSSKIYNDLLTYPIHISPQDYAAFVALHFPEGLASNQVFITDVYLKKISYNKEAAKYEVALRIKKLLYTSYNEDKKKVKLIKEGRVHVLDMNINIPDDLMGGNAKLLSITGPIITRKKNKSSWVAMGATGMYHIPQLSVSEELSPSSSLKLIGGAGGGLSMNYLKGLSRKKNHFLVLGIGAHILSYKIEGNKSRVNFDDTRLVQAGISGGHVLEWNEESNNSLKRLSGLIGVSLGLMKKYRSTSGLGIYAQPYYLLNSNPKSIPLNLIQRAGNLEWCNSSVPLELSYNKIGYSILVSPFYEKDINDSGTRHFRINFDLSYAISSIVDQSKTNGRLIELESNINESVIPSVIDQNIFFKSFKPHYVGIRIEYMLRSNKR